VTPLDVADEDPTGYYDILEQDIDSLSGSIHLILRRHYSPKGPIYYCRSDNAGLTWSTPVAIVPSHPLPWTGGTIYQTSARDYISCKIHARGDRIAVAIIEDWTEQKYYHGTYPHRNWPGPITYEEYWQRYTPTAILLTVSHDGGQTWTPVSRQLNDPGGAVGGGYAWGKDSPGGIGISPTFPPWGDICVGSQGDDLVVLFYCYQITKPTTFIPGDCPFFGY